ncbi:hypothetical protein J4Q44_G00204710 [Coregonus suidteri]|uniref:methylcrotonoyl-CoA carboxylase n=1 Tax=Coregonus suidteri TaxID=861788 RepID=A0AAN8LEQ1_9TELE
MLVTARLRMLLDDGYYLELSPFAGMGLPYGDIPSAGCVTGIGQINGLWCVFIANDVTVSGGTAYPITVKKQLRAQDVAIQNRLPCVYLVDSGEHRPNARADPFPNPGRDQQTNGSGFNDVCCVSVPKITVVIGGYHGPDSYAMCGRSFDPKFLFPWPNARVSLLTPGQSAALAQEEEDIEKINKRLEKESSAFFSSGRLWDDGVILPQDTWKVLSDSLKIKQQEYQLSKNKLRTPLL